MTEMRHLLRVASALLLVVACAGAEEIVARVGDMEITLTEFEATARKLRKTGYDHIEKVDQAAKLELLDGVIARELLVIEGRKRGIDRDPTIAAEILKTEQRALMSQLYEKEAVQKEYPHTDADLRAFFAEYQYDSEVFSRHIVCDSLDQALEVLTALKSGVRFESLVDSYSIRHIQDRYGPGGWVGWFKTGELYEELRIPLSTMPVGQFYPEPIKTPLGYHVFGLKARRPLDFEAAREWLIKRLRVQRRADDMALYVIDLRDRYNLVAHHEAFQALRSIHPETTALTDSSLAIFTWRGGRLTLGDYLALLKKHRARNPANLDSAQLYAAADNLAGREIMKTEARRLGLDRDLEVRNRVESKRAELLVKWLYHTEAKRSALAKISDQDVRTFYDQNLDLFTREDGKVTEFSFIRDSIRTLIRNQAETKAMDEFLAGLRKTYKDQIEIYPDVLALAFAKDPAE
jgi:peptidyl-prolyl cis-trans isomerase C